MELTGEHFLEGRWQSAGEVPFFPLDPRTGADLAPRYFDAPPQIVAAAVAAAARAFEAYRHTSKAARAAFLRRLADELEELGDVWIERAHLETGLGRDRLLGERGRTVGQARLFATVVEEGSWVEARVDRALPDRQPLPRPDLRRMLLPLGPIAVFGASNFPFAFSVAGGDTVSALAAGCPVVVKGHPAHPGTSELAARAIEKAVVACGLPAGVFSLIQGARAEVGQALVSQPGLAAVAFTGSYGGGRALVAAAAARSIPIPVYAEMGSANPVFVLPRALAERGDGLAEGLAASVTLGAGQFCTNPGLAVMVDSHAADLFLSTLGQRLAAAPAGLMVHPGIAAGYWRSLAAVTEVPGVSRRAAGVLPVDAGPAAAAPALLEVGAAAFLGNQRLGEEIFGPATLAVRCPSREEVFAVAASLQGHLTATIHATDEDLAEYSDLLPLLAGKVGRVIVNGFPTGVEVAPAMQHGGPFPASSDARSTSVGTAAITRFARPVCFQNVPDVLLPPELKVANPLGIWRWIDGTFAKEPA